MKQLNGGVMICACHPADKTARAQILSQNFNPDLYGVLQAFEKLTGRGALLNTSFNLHGFPIVNTAEHAMNVFKKSGLDVLLLNDYMVIKSDPQYKK